MKKKKAKATAPALRAKATYYAKPLVNRPKDLAKVKERITLRNEHVAAQNMVHRQNERARINTMLNENVSPQLRSTLLKNLSILK